MFKEKMEFATKTFVGELCRMIPAASIIKNQLAAPAQKIVCAIVEAAVARVEEKQKEKDGKQQ